MLTLRERGLASRTHQNAGDIVVAAGLLRGVHEPRAKILKLGVDP